jgi:hypothetical protein
MLLSRAEGFSCSLEVLGGGLPLGIKFFILKNPELDSDPELAPDPDQIRIDLKCWIRIRSRSTLLRVMRSNF